MAGNEKYAVITRSDRMSSVIKRDPQVVNTGNDNDKSATERGFCECGWPLNMLMPRGNHVSEPEIYFFT